LMYVILWQAGGLSGWDWPRCSTLGIGPAAGHSGARCPATPPGRSRDTCAQPTRPSRFGPAAAEDCARNLARSRGRARCGYSPVCASRRPDSTASTNAWQLRSFWSAFAVDKSGSHRRRHRCCPGTQTSCWVSSCSRGSPSSRSARSRRPSAR
jgi:hypothetical protein